MYELNRPESLVFLSDAEKLNYRKILDDNNFPKNMDYLQIDLDVNNKSTLNTLMCLNDTVCADYKFATITFEHDIYTGDYFDTRKISREIFASRGYTLLFPDVSVFWLQKVKVNLKIGMFIQTSLIQILFQHLIRKFFKVYSN